MSGKIMPRLLRWTAPLTGHVRWRREMTVFLQSDSRGWRLSGWCLARSADFSERSALMCAEAGQLLDEVSAPFFSGAGGLAGQLFT